MTELLQFRLCLNYGMWRTLSIFLETTNDFPCETIDLAWSVQLSTDKIVLPNDLTQ